MDKGHRISASIAPAPPVFPPGSTPRLGLLVLDTRFPRPQGDLGNAASWPWPVERVVVRGVGPADAVQTAQGMDMSRVLPPFEAALRSLEHRGVAAVTTSCGFLVLLQQALQAGASVPVITSSLLQLPALLEEDEQVGVLTISAERLGRAHLLQAGVPERRLGDVIVQGVSRQSEFCRAILGDDPVMDLDQAGSDVIEAALALKARAPHLRTLVLECTNMPPYTGHVRDATGWRVISLLDSPVLHHALQQEGAAR